VKICFILEYYHPHVGGMEYLFQNLAEHLVRRGHEITVVTQRIAGTPSFELINGVAVRRIRTGNRYLFGLAALVIALKLARKCDIIQTSTFNSAFPAWFAARFLGIPVVLTVHEVWMKQWHSYTDMPWPKASFHHLLERILYLFPFDRYVAVSHSTERQLLSIGIRAGLLQTVYNGFDSSYFDPDRYDGSVVRTRHRLQDAFLCFSWGRPGMSKGHEYFLHAVPLILREIPHARFILVLSDTRTYEARTRSLMDIIRQHGIQDKVIIVEHVPRAELGHYLKAADCVVIPSIAEGFGYAVLEAATMRAPIVASDTTSIPEVIGGKYILVEPKNATALTAGVVRIKAKDYLT
jgi:D-inositol-3-phosphate glycosyltransferase